MTSLDAAVLGKAYVTKGVSSSVRIGAGPGPVQHKGFPSESRYLPTIVSDPSEPPPRGFKLMRPSDFGNLLPVVGTAEWVRRLCEAKGKGADVRDVQVRLKGRGGGEVDEVVAECQR